MGLKEDLDDIAALGPDFDDLIDKVKQLNRAAAGTSAEVGSEFVKAIKKVQKSYSDLYVDVERVREGTVRTKTLEDKSAQLRAKMNQLQQKANDLRKVGTQDAVKQAALLEQAAQAAYDTSLGYQQLADINDKLDQKTGFFKSLAGITSQIPGLEKVSGNFSTIEKEIRNVAVSTGDLNKAFEAGFKIMADIVFKAFIAQLFIVNKELTEFQKSLNLSRGDALETKLEFASIAVLSGDVAINSVRIAKANAELNKQLGTAAVFSDEILISFSKLTEVVGLSAEAAGSLAQQALISGQELRTVEENALGGSYALQRSAGIALNNKEILEETGKVTGQVRINLGANPALIAQAVTKAKLLGMELNTIANASRQLLDFESSIGAELEAELLTGKQLNLERARALALQGKLAEVADEIAAQNINFSEFQDMNVLQQEALAKAVGMTANGLSDALLIQEAQGRTAEQLRAIGKDELADRLEALSAQEKISLFIEKATVAFGSMAAVLSPIVDFIGNIFVVMSSLPGQIMLGVAAFAKLLPLLIAARKFMIGKTIAQVFGAMVSSLGPFGIPAAIAAVAALGMTIAQYSKADDMYGDMTLITKRPKGAIALNNNDQFIAGTNLFDKMGNSGGGGMYGDMTLITKRPKGAIALNNNDQFIAGTNLFDKMGNSGGGGMSKNDLDYLVNGINNKKVKFDTYDSAGPQAMVDSFSKNENNLFI